jgi:heme A synthase
LTRELLGDQHADRNHQQQEDELLHGTHPLLMEIVRRRQREVDGTAGRYPPVVIPGTRLSRFAYAVLGYNLAVVLFGAVVRATGSGAGCGASWPTCGEAFIPVTGDAERFIEFAHRASSGVALVLVALLVAWVLRTHPRGSAVRIAAIASGILIVNEALIGAALVLFEWVAEDASVGRVVSITLHLVNTFLLLGALLLTAWFSSGHPVPKRPLPERAVRFARWGAIGLIAVGALGAITALGDTLVPPEDIASGILDDLQGVLVTRLRWAHPVLAVGVAVYLLRAGRFSGRADRIGRWLRAAVLGQLAIGVINVLLRAPLGTQLVHLFVADAVWLLFVLTSTEALADRSRQEVSA